MSTLSPFDLLFLSDVEQSVFRALAKWPKQTVNQLAENCELTLDEVDTAVSALLTKGSIIEQLKEGKRVLSVRLQFKRKEVRNMPAAIVDAFAKSSQTFLNEIPLTQDLTAEEMSELLRLSQKRVLVPDEVLSWQGEKFNFVAVVETGLIVQTRLKSQHLSEKVGYTRRAEWIGISSVMGNTVATETFTAVTETTLLVWTREDFTAYLNQNTKLAMALCHHLSQALEMCKSTKLDGKGKLWVVEGVRPQVGVTTFAENLASIAYSNSQDVSGKSTILWQRNPTQPCPKEGQSFKDLAIIQTHPTGFDELHLKENYEYPPQVQLDILLGELLATYEYVICDVGSESEEELFLRLKGQGQPLITLTSDAKDLDNIAAHWQKNQNYTIPSQKRLLALNNTTQKVAEVDPRFHIVIPKDTQLGKGNSKSTVLPNTNASNYRNAIDEIYRRLSLNHALAIFVPSTLDVNQPVDNEHQVQSTLEFLGQIFGGATKTNAEGVWRSEDNGLVTEQVTMVRTFVSKPALEANLNLVVEFATQLKKEMKQEAVALSVDHQLILV